MPDPGYIDCMGKLLAVDPGANQGWAIYTSGRLTACGSGFPPVEALEGLTECLLERPTSYRGSPVPPAALIILAGRMGIAAGQVLATTGIVADYVEPRTWKGSVTKRTHQPRIWAALDSEEQARCGVAVVAKAPATVRKYDGFADYLASAPEGANGRDIMDAVGLGLYGVGRSLRGSASDVSLVVTRKKHPKGRPGRRRYA